MRPRGFAAGVIATVVLVVTAGSAGGAAERSRPTRPPRVAIDRVLIVSLPGVGWRDLARDDLPNLRALLGSSAVADLSTRAPGIRNDLAGNYASLSAGDKAVGPTRMVDVAGVATPGATYRVDEDLGETTAGEIFTRRTGKLATVGLVVFDAARVIAANNATPYQATIGAFGDALARAGWNRSVIANADGAEVPGGPAQARRTAAIAMMDGAGTVPGGEVGAELLAAAPMVPFGKHLDADAVERAFTAAWTPKSVVLVEGSDLARVEEYRPTVSARRARQLRANALRRTDALVGQLVTHVDFERDAVVVLGTAPNPADGRLAAVAVRAPGIAPGLLRSGTTQRTGFVQLMDVAPSVLDLVGVETPQTMRGRAVAVGQTSADAARSRRFLIDADTATQFRAEVQAPVASVLMVMMTGLIGIAVAATARPRSVWPAVARWWAAVTLALLPTIFLARALPFHRIGIGGYWAWIGLGTVAVAAGARVIGRRHALDSVLALLAASVVVLGVDAVAGSPLQFNGALGFSPEIAGRFIGFGNAGYAVFSASGLFLAVLSVVRFPRAGRLVALSVLTAVVVVDGAPFWGADVGGVLSLVPAFVIVGVQLLGWRIRLRTALLALAGTAVAAAGAIAVDLARSAGSRSHLGRLVEQIRRGGGSEFVDVVVRKLDANLSTWSTSPFRWMVPLLIGGIAALWLIPNSNLPAVWRRLDPTRALTMGFPTLVVLGYGLNDTGVLVIALMGTVGLAAVVSVGNHCGVENDLTVPDYRAVSTHRIRGGLRHAVRERSHRP